MDYRKYIKWIKPALMLLAIILMFVSAKTGNRAFAMSGAVLLVVAFTTRFFRIPDSGDDE